MRQSPFGFTAITTVLWLSSTFALAAPADDPATDAMTEDTAPAATTTLAEATTVAEATPESPMSESAPTGESTPRTDAPSNLPEDVPTLKDVPADEDPTTDSATPTTPKKRFENSFTTRTEVAARIRDSGDRDAGEFTKARQYVYWRGKYNMGEFLNSKAATFQFKLRGHYDAIYDWTDRYPDRVERDEESDLDIREAVLALNSGKLDLRIGRQQVVWGESVGLFFADIVNPKDFREFLLPDLDDVRIPLWGVDAVYDLGKNRALELFWTPEARFSELPEPGSEFEFFTPSVPPGIVVNLGDRDEQRATSLSNSTVGIRYSFLKDDLDAALFYLYAFDDLPAISKELVMGPPTVNVRFDHPRVHRFGATLSKPVGKAIIKSELVYTTGREFEIEDIGPADERDYLTAMVGVNYPISRYSFDAQLFHSAILGSGEPLRERKSRTGVSLRLADDASLRRLKPEILFVASLNQGDIWFSPRVHYRINEGMTLTLGVDYFNGKRDTLFGQFKDASRVQAQLTWNP